MNTTNTSFIDPATRAPSRNSIAAILPLRSSSTRSHDGSAARSRGLDVHEDDFDAASVLTEDSGPRTRVFLRRKPKSISISDTPVRNPPPVHMRRLSGISRTLSFPTFHPHSDPDDSRPVSSHSALPPSTPKLQSTLVPPNRSPSQKRRPPASHSSYGVETTLGPPPSYSTQQQRSVPQERVRVEQPRQKAGAGSERVTPQLNEVATTTKQQSRDVPTNDHLTALPVPRSSDPDFSSPETLDSQSLNTPREGSVTTPPTSAGGTNMAEADEAVPKGLGLDGTQDDAKASSSDETQRSEDLFLNIAKTDASRPAAPRVDKRRSRISLPFFSGPRPATAAARSSPMSSQFETSHITPRSERPIGKRSSLGQHVPGALTSSSSYFDDTRSHVGKPSDQRSVAESTGERSQLRSRRHSNANTDTLRPPTRTGRSRMVSENLYADRFRRGEQVATESTISTTAPSTVWDELDDLKSRIKKLELTGKLPPSSAAAMTTNERPRTATTAATTLSSSPRENKAPVASLPSAIEGVPSTIHPLLHEALSNAKSGMNQDVYQKLQATAQDALQLSSMLSQEGYGTNGQALSPQTERNIRRRTESMCRSLTELAIALLSENRNVNSPTTRPPSREQHTGSAGTLRTRTYSNDAPTDRPPVTSRVQSRLDSRRTSLLIGQTQTTSPATEAPRSTSTFRTPPTSVASQPVSASRVSRVSTVTRNRRTQNSTFLDGATDNEDEDSPIVATRPVSRAATEVGSTYRSLARDRANFSREYTKQHPLPTQTAPADSPSVSSRVALPSNLSINSRVSSRRIHPSPASEIASPSLLDNSSPVTTPSHVNHQAHTPSHVTRPPFTISIERRKPHLAESTSNSPVVATPESVASGGSDRRPSSTRRSLGFASRISSVSNRLKAARAERMASNPQTAANMAAVRSPLSSKDRDHVEAQDVDNASPPEALPASVTLTRGS